MSPSTDMIIVGFMRIKYNEVAINYNKKTMKVDKIFHYKYNVMWICVSFTIL